MNSIDLVVGVNVIYGIKSCVLAQLEYPEKWFDNELQIYENTTELITWIVEQNFSSRPDLSLMYYPSTHNLLQTYSSKLNLPLPFSVPGRVMDMLAKTLRGAITYDLLERAILDHEGLVYYQDFLGKDDMKRHGGRFIIITNEMSPSGQEGSWIF